MTTEKPIRSRYVRGNLPDLVGVIAKNPSSKPGDWRTLDRRSKDDALAAAHNLVLEGKINDLRSEWEIKTNKAIQRNTVKKRVNDVLLHNHFSLEDRRNQLRDLLDDEYNQYVQEMETKIETPIERRAKMREKAVMLRRQREAERQELLATKEDQRWRANCEELRTLMSKRSSMKLNAEREKQLKIKQEQMRQNADDEKFFHQLWEADLQKKALREEKETMEKYEREKEALIILREQMAASDSEKQQLQKLKEEEYALLVQEEKLRKYEDEQAAMEKRRKQEETRNALTRSMQQRHARENKLRQEEMELDLKILETILEGNQNEAYEQQRKKTQLRKEQEQYMDYLHRLRLEEIEQEKELERYCDAEAQKANEKRAERWRKERAARKKLMEDVIEGRRLQINQRLAEIEKAKLEEAEEKQRTLEAMVEQHRLEAEDRRQRLMKSKQFKHELNGQLEYQARLKALENDEIYRETLRQYEEEAAYQAKLRAALERPPDNLHPLIKMASAQ